jgi:hypothetical protein
MSHACADALRQHNFLLGTALHSVHHVGFTSHAIVKIFVAVV